MECRNTKSHGNGGKWSDEEKKTPLLRGISTDINIAYEYLPKRNSLPPPAGVATTACAERGPGHVGEVNRRHSS